MRYFGVTCSHFHRPHDEANQLRLQRYVDAVGDAGGGAELLFLPERGTSADALAEQAARMATQLDGLVLSGGADLPSAMFGEEDLPEANIKPVVAERPAYEAQLIDRFLERGKPVLGICYGCQLLNVRSGGSLVQDIPLQWNNPIVHSSGVHEIRVGESGLLHDIVGVGSFEATTSHHQAVKRVPTGAYIAAQAPDAIVEAVVFSAAPFVLGVQWHPECDRGTPASERLFARFVREAA
jgi:putative glutamine amidotransferase